MNRQARPAGSVENDSRETRVEPNLWNFTARSRSVHKLWDCQNVELSTG
jgi:hypothetical protein